MADMTLPIRGTILGKVEGLDDPVGDDDYEGERRPVDLGTPVEDSNIITSLQDGHTVEQIENKDTYHRIILDIDAPVKVVPSSTGGHFHLYIDVAVHWDEYSELLDALVNAGVLEEGYVEASKREGYTSARLPWIKKTNKKEV